VRSRTIDLSNSAKLPSICMTMRPAEVVVSTASVMLRKPAPASRTRSMMWRRRPGKPIELPNDQHIPFTELFQGLVKLRPIPLPTGGPLLEDSLATDVAQGFYLGRSVLV